MRLPFAKGSTIQKATPFDESIELAKKEGATHIYIEGSSKTDNVDTWTEEKIVNSLEVLSANSLRAIYHGNYRNPIAHEIPQIRAAALSYMKKEVDIAARLGAPLIVHGSSLFTHSNRDALRRDALLSFAEEVNKLSEYALSKGVDIWLENLEHYSDKRPFYTLFSRCEEYEVVLNNVHDSVRMILDFGHENISSSEPWETFEKFCSRISAISVSNNNGAVDSHAMLHKGNANFENLIEAIVRNKWAGHITVETKAGGISEAEEYLMNSYNEVISNRLSSVAV